jgi:mannose-6-phosphate isomerase-like protein (cupin superfamily)
VSIEAQSPTSPYDFSQPQPFTMIGTPLLTSGKSSDLLALAPQLWVSAKVYAEGGERGFHSHPTEDHLFFVLAGKAIFSDSDNQTTVVEPFAGIMIPRSVVYSFSAVGDENLVILRVGAGESSAMKNGIVAAKQSTHARSPEKGSPRPGSVFTAPSS